jgi:hypothetical protein
MGFGGHGRGTGVGFTRHREGAIEGVAVAVGGGFVDAGFRAEGGGELGGVEVEGAGAGFGEGGGAEGAGGGEAEGCVCAPSFLRPPMPWSSEAMVATALMEPVMVREPVSMSASPSAIQRAFFAPASTVPKPLMKVSRWRWRLVSKAIRVPPLKTKRVVALVASGLATMFFLGGARMPPLRLKVPPAPSLLILEEAATLPSYP